MSTTASLQASASIEVSTGVLVWWAGLSTVAILNVALWLSSLRRWRGMESREGREHAAVRRRHLILSGIYVLGCGFRSVVPRADVQRICLVDSWISTVLIGRAVATVAEVAFVAQWALLLREYGKAARSPVAVTLARILVPLILFAETCSWYAVLSTNYLGNTMEESTWGVTATLMTIGMITLWPRSSGKLRSFLGSAIFVSVGYVGFMSLGDVPMYFTRWRADTVAGRVYFTLSAGLHDLATRWVPTFSMADWRQEIPWMSLYFSLAVWGSLYLTHAPRWAAAPVDPTPGRGVARS